MTQKSTFNVITQSSLSSDDFKVLSLLYQPILGTLAHSLYLTLYQLINRNNYQSSHHTMVFLSDLINEKVTAINEARMHLEALNLLETYQKDQHFIFQIRTPLSPRGFIKDTILGQFLLSEVGNKVYQSLIDLFKVEKVSIEGFTQVSKQFDDLYTFKPMKNLSSDVTLLGKKNNQGTNISNQINFDAFVEKLSNRLKKPSLMSENTQNFIQKLVFIYQFSLDEMVSIYQQAANRDGVVDLNQLQLKAQMYYLEYKQDLPVVESAKKDEKINSIHLLKTITPMRIVKNYAKDDYQYMAVDTVIELMNRHDSLEVGIINVLLMHVLKRKDGALPHVNYLEKVLESWLKRGITTTELAVDFVSNIEQYAKRPTDDKKASQASSNHWIDDYWNELDNVEVER